MIDDDDLLMNINDSLLKNKQKLCKGNAIKAETEGASQDGYVLTWVNGNNQWEAKSIMASCDDVGSVGSRLKQDRRPTIIEKPMYVGNNNLISSNRATIHFPKWGAKLEYLNRFFLEYLYPHVGYDFHSVYIIGSSIRHPGFKSRKKYFFFGKEFNIINKMPQPNDIDILVFTEQNLEELNKKNHLVCFNGEYNTYAYEGNIHVLFQSIKQTYREVEIDRKHSLVKAAEQDGFPLFHWGNPMFYSKNLKETVYHNDIHLSFVK